MKIGKVIVVLGPNASGKSDLAVEIAKFIRQAEIISADSRQVYKGFNLTAGTVPLDKNSNYKNIKHHLIAVTSPKKTFSVAQYQKLGRKVIHKILKEDKVPIICGGTGLYIDSLIYNINFPSVKANLKLRKQLEKLPADELYRRLKKLDPGRSKNIDRFNKRRLIRAIEIV
ncbi:MAG: tRNA (adenosine(37)-N6)-dimethylallyltransferase MiaA, partial [Candidatus Paceibacterota bacterium]